MRPPTVLFADTEKGTLAVALQALSGIGLSVESATDGQDALRKLREKAFGVLVADINLPRGAGLDFLAQVKAVSPELPVILITSQGSVQGAVSALQAGASDYLLKPMAPDLLAAAVRRAQGLNGHATKEVTLGRASAEVTRSEKRIITGDPTLLEILKTAKKIAPSRATVLILGESGTGKELLAAHIHAHGGPAGRPLVAMNCAALPESLAESELFGHEKGTFTGAVKTKIGRFEAAHGGTLLLDEISELPLPLQAKLLRALQEREIDRVGSTRPIPVDVRVIAISNLDLRQAVGEGRFRQDLFYRINVIPFRLPPLRGRPGDIALLANHFLQKYAAANRRPVREISAEALRAMQGHPWPGNVRELENAIERAVLVGEGDMLEVRHLALDTEEPSAALQTIPAPAAGLSVREMEKRLIQGTLRDVNHNRTQAAEMLGISIRTLRNKLKEYQEEQRA